MDTRFWGPPGWNLLHFIADKYKKKNKHDYYLFFLSLPKVLPCIYCRNSLNAYYKETPLKKENLVNNQSLQKWLYDIHNLVNNKLRKQGLNYKKDPDFESIYKKYQGCQNSYNFVKKNTKFLYAIALNYPVNETFVTKIQKYHYQVFFIYLIKILLTIIPNKNVNIFIKKYPIHLFLKNNDTLTKWLFIIDYLYFGKTHCYDDKCQSIEKYRAGCKGNKNDKKPTCRRIKKN